eukprot:scaffold12639_cov16-Tisochrysis_lutea.AAC.3
MYTCAHAEASAAASSDAPHDAHDALVWGLIVHIATDDELLKSSDHDKLQMPKMQHKRAICLLWKKILRQFVTLRNHQGKDMLRRTEYSTEGKNPHNTWMRKSRGWASKPSAQS